MRAHKTPILKTSVGHFLVLMGKVYLYSTFIFYEDGMQGSISTISKMLLIRKITFLFEIKYSKADSRYSNCFH